jgi:hypothetical protein
MKNLKKFRVFGRYAGKRIDETLTAYSKKQAKLQAGFNNGFYGSVLSRFMKSRSVKVV